MKQYVIDELRPPDHDSLKTFLDDHFGPAEMEGIYWIPVPEALLSDVQSAHDPCRPFFFVADLEDSRLSVELLVRTRNTIRCICIAYATPRQREWLIDYVDSIFDSLKLIT